MGYGECHCGGSESEIERYRPLTELTGLLSRKYALFTFGVIDAHGPMRFRTLDRHLPDASSATLSDRLDELTTAGLVTRTQYDENPPRVEYELTTDGETLRGLLDPLRKWTELGT